MSDSTPAPLEGLFVVDWTEVQSGPSCTQMLAWFGAEVVKIERLTGDPTRKQLSDRPDADSLYFYQLNSGKKSLAVDVKTPQGKEILTALLKKADFFVENLHPGAVDELGFGWDDVHRLNPRCIMGSIKGFNPNSRFEHIKAYEPIAQCTGGAASTTGWFEGGYDIPTLTGATLGDTNSGMHLLIGLLAALQLRERTGEGCHVYQSMQNACLNLCRMKLHDQIYLENRGVLPEYPEYPYIPFGDSVPHQANAEGGGEFGWCYKCKNWKDDPNDWVYVVLQRDPVEFAKAAAALGHPEWVDDERFNTAEARFAHKKELYAAIEEYTVTRDKYEVTEELGAAGIPVGPVLSWKEIKNDAELERCGQIVKVSQDGPRKEFLTVGCPVLFSDFTPEIGAAPALGADNGEILSSLGYTQQRIEELKAAKVIGQ